MLQVKIKKKLGNFLLDVDFSMDGGVFASWEHPDVEKYDVKMYRRDRTPE